MNRLNDTTSLPDEVRRPHYDRTATGVGIIHLGIGAFHRAHQAEFTEDVLERFGGDWGILGVSLRSAGVRDQLAPQNGLYTLVERRPDGDALRLVGAVKGVLVATESPRAVIAAMADPKVTIVSLTVTEKGYCHDPATGTLNLEHPDIVHDLVHPDAPRSAVGYLVAALAARRAAGAPPLTVVCCDNLPHNGAVVARVTAALATARDPALGDWITQTVAFPATMVDRIVPATTPEDIAALAARLGARDLGMVKAEPFRQWVIEDRFAGARPAWEAVGAQLVADVRPFEDAKLRLLNGSHSMIAYLGQLAGFAYVHEAVRDPAFAALIAQVMAQEIAPTLTPAPGLDLPRYQRDLMARFANPALNHRTAQIAMDGSQKLPQRLLNTARARLKIGAPIDRIALAVAAWVRFAAGFSETGPRFEVQDPMAAQFQAIAASAGAQPEPLADGFLGLSTVFGQDLPANPAFVTAVKTALEHLFRHGARATAARWSDA